MIDTKTRRLRVTVVSDGVVTRTLLVRLLERDPGLDVSLWSEDEKAMVRSMSNGLIDVILLEIGGAHSDGMERLNWLLETAPKAKIIVFSEQAAVGARICLKALEIGACDYISEPSKVREISMGEAFKTQLLSKTKHFARLAREEHKLSSSVGSQGERRKMVPHSFEETTISLRKMPLLFRPDLLAIGSSTGGPQVLLNVLKRVGRLRFPILLTQHMPKMITSVLATHIERYAGVEAIEAVDGMRLQPGRVHLAPGDYHMVLEKTKETAILRLNKAPPENYCRPSVDPMLRSVAAIYGAKALAVILTGMGQDGLLGCRALVKAGGVVFAQDQASSVVWGMPGAVAEAGLCTKVLDVEQMGTEVAKLFAR